jgi:hypothetical protein
MPWRYMGEWRYSSTTSALDGSRWAASRPSPLTPGTPWIGGTVGPRIGLDAMEKRKIFPCRESNPGRPACSLVAIPTELQLEPQIQQGPRVNCYPSLLYRAVVLNLGYAYPRRYAKTSYGLLKIKKKVIISWYALNNKLNRLINRSEPH